MKSPLPGLAAATLFVVSVLTPVPALADSYRQVLCSSQGYKGYNRVFYKSASSTAWQITATQYNFQPANSASTHNNQNFNVHSSAGSSGNIYSPDTLKRDAKWHYNTQGGLYRSAKGSTYVYFYDIFDIPSVHDAACDVNTPTF